MSRRALMCANQGCPSAAVCARFTSRPHLGHVFPFAKGSGNCDRADFVPDRRGKCPQFAKRSAVKKMDSGLRRNDGVELRKSTSAQGQLI